MTKSCTTCGRPMLRADGSHWCGYATITRDRLHTLEELERSLAKEEPAQ